MNKWYYQKSKKKNNTLRPISKGYGKQRHTPTITNLTLLPDPTGDQRFEMRRYDFAITCYLNRDKLHNGNTWEEIFERNEGVSLWDYIKFANENNFKEKFADRKKPKKFITTFVKE